MRSSEEPLARITFRELEEEVDGGESARQRRAELWALKRKMSLKVTLWFDLVVSSGCDRFSCCSCGL